MTLLWFVGALLMLGTLAALLLVASRRQQLGRAFLLVSLVPAGFWAFAKWATERDVRDANGYDDCWPSCSPLQQTVAAGFGWAPIAWFLLALFASVLAALSGPRGREWQPLRCMDHDRRPSR